ncbi:MAG: hypothetical protein LJE84_12000 [Gammaproteobacteria bacterium]|nr:hypothetical protein [Gammaproteobacteria bacterium]
MKQSPWIITAALATTLAGCAERDTATTSPAASASVYEITARGLALEAADEIPSGWTTIRFNNQSGMVHFALVERLPEGHGVKEQQDQVAPVFQQGMDLLNAGNKKAANQKFGELPEWFGKIVFLGGPGMTTPGRIAETTVYLEPGNYMAECYVKTNGVFHSYNPDPQQFGMVHGFRVTTDKSGAPQPQATVRITLSGDKGIEVDGNPNAGEHTVAVHFADQKVHANFLGHDVHLARLADDTDLEKLATWMDWRQPNGLETPAPVEFFGGIHDMPAGSTGYFKVRLNPGRYAWVAEVDDPAQKNMLKVFTVR